MAFEKGKSGNPGGRASNKEWRDAIRKAVHERRVTTDDGKTEKIKSITLLARKLVTKALDGDVTAMKEIGDRLDGKPKQSVDLSGVARIKRIERVIVQPALQDAAAEAIDITPAPVHSISGISEGVGGKPRRGRGH